jgi:hypothetical protein
MVVAVAVLHKVLIYAIATQRYGTVLYHVGPEVLGGTP